MRPFRLHKYSWVKQYNEQKKLVYHFILQKLDLLQFKMFLLF